MRGNNLNFQGKSRKRKSHREIRIQEIGEIEDKGILAFEIVKSRGRSGAVGLVGDHGRWLCISQQGVPSDVILGYRRSRNWEQKLCDIGDCKTPKLDFPFACCEENSDRA
jgi:hypothetical protein